MRYRVGRHQGTKLVHAFDIEPKDGGGIHFSDVTSLSDSEHLLIMQHFGRPQDTRLSIGSEQHIRTLAPGTDKHFIAAVSVLPEPFALMGGKS